MDKNLVPLVTVIIPVKNSERFLADAIDSVLRQTYANLEILIIYQASTDTTEEILRQYLDPRIRVIYNPADGIASSLNLGISEAKGKYVARMDSDDVCHEDRINSQYEFILKNKSAKVVFTCVELIDESCNYLGYWAEDKHSLTPEEIRNQLQKANCLAHSTLFIETDLLANYKYSCNQLNAEDYDLWLRLSSDSIMIYKLPKSLLKYRVHSNSVTQVSNNNASSAINIITKVRYLLFNRRLSTFNFILLRNIIFLDLPPHIISILKQLIIDIVMLIVAKIGYLSGISIIQKKYKYIFFFPFYHTGGAERVHKEIVRLADSDSLVVFTEKSTNSQYLPEFKLHADVIDISSILANPLNYAFYQGIIARDVNANDGVVTFGANCSFYYRLMSLLNKSIKTVDLLHALGAGVEHFSLRCVKYIKVRIVITKSIKHFLRIQYNQNNLSQFYDRIQIITNFTKVPAKLSKTSNDRRILFVGRNSPEKRFHILKGIALQMISHNIQFEVVGDFHDETDSTISNINYHGQVDNDLELKVLYEMSDMLVITSSREGFPLVAAEAMANGTIVLSTNVGGLSDHIKSGENGFLVSNATDEVIIQSMIQVITRVFSDEKLLIKIRKNAFEYAKLNFSYKRFKSAYKLVLR